MHWLWLTIVYCLQLLGRCWLRLGCFCFYLHLFHLFASLSVLIDTDILVDIKALIGLYNFAMVLLSFLLLLDSAGVMGRPDLDCEVRKRSYVVDWLLFDGCIGCHICILLCFMCIIIVWFLLLLTFDDVINFLNNVPIVTTLLVKSIGIIFKLWVIGVNSKIGGV